MSISQSTSKLTGLSEATAVTTWQGVKLKPFLITISIGVAITLIPVPQALTAQTWRLFAIFTSIIVGLITRPIATTPVVLLGMLVAIVTNTLSFNEIFIGFSQPSIWLIVTSFFLARGLIKTGVAIRASYFFVYLFGKTTLGLAYGIIGSELLLAPFIPSLVARSGGIILPIVLSLAKSNGSTPEESPQRMGTFLLVTVFQTSLVASAMFLTSTAVNPVAAQIALDFGINMTWGKWALATSIPGLCSLIVVPLVLYKMIPPEIKATPEAPMLAKQKMQELGKMSINEWIMVGIFLIVLSLWLFGSYIGINNTVAALIGLILLLLTGVLDWKKDCLNEGLAWDTLFWLGSLIAIGTALKGFGFFDWFSSSLVGYISNFHWQPALVIMSLFYFYSHYFFASNTAHLSAMFAAFLAAAISFGAPAMLAAFLLATFSSLFGGLTHYACGPAPIYFAAGYVSIKKWWSIGLIISIINIVIWLVVGGFWWKIIGLW